MTEAEERTMRKAERGRRAWHAGASAEESVERLYLRQGLTVAARRWRKGGGEIDLILRDGDGVVFVEVKQAPDFERAAARVTERQIARIHAGAAHFLAGEPKGELTPCRFDVALVNATGETRILESAF
ncbi:YraN family protein [Shimia aestuarii]|uniref:YraN family protein n=1 Tax=Shimia aestuarii TaxID=254406 RepID=UPI001FB54C2E|nr:YraN family protein [Shimia aestuarii]